MKRLIAALAAILNFVLKIVLLLLVIAAVGAIWFLGGPIWVGIAIASVALLLGLIVLVAFILANSNILFVRIESNHLCCAEVDGQFYSFFCHSDDKEEILKAFEAEAVRQKQDLTKPAYTDARNLLDRRIRARDNEGGIAEWLVKHFNLHFMTFNPFVRLRKFKLIKSRINAENTSGNVEEMISVEPEIEEEFLRIKWPRPIFMKELELKNNVQTNIAATNTEFTVIDPYPIYYKNQEISRWADWEMRAALIQHLGRMTFDEFSEEDFTATNTKFTDAIAAKGDFGKLGLSATGKFAIVDWNLAGSQAELMKQQQRKAAAAAKSEADLEEAQGRIKVIAQEGVAKASAAAALKDALAGDPNAALVLMAQELKTATSPIVLGGGIMPTLNIETNKKKGT